MAIVTALVIETDMAIATVLTSKPTFMAIVTILASKPTFIAIVTALVIEIDIYSYCDRTGLETDMAIVTALAIKTDMAIMTVLASKPIWLL